MLFQTSLGIDIQANSVSLAYLKASFKGVRLAAHATYPLEEGLPVKEKADLIWGLVKAFLKKNSISPAAVFLGIPRDIAILRYMELPLAVKENLRDTLGYEMEKHVPFSADEIHFDYQVIAEDKENGTLRVLLIAAKKESVDPYYSLASKLGIKLSGIEINSTAVANFFSIHPGSDDRDTCAFVYLREGGLEIGLLKAGLLDYTRPISRAEWGLNLPERLLQELLKLREGLGDREGPLKTVLCGAERDGALLDRLRKEDDIDIRLMDLSAAGVPSSATISAYGLALKGIRKVPVEVNLMPAELRKKASRAGYYSMFVLAGLLALLAFAWVGGSVLDKQLYLRQLEEEIDGLTAEIKNIDRIKMKSKKIEERIDFLNLFQRRRLNILDIIKELSQRIPKSAWLLKFTFNDRKGEVEIQGWADSASELIPLLDESRLFKDVAFLSSITTSHAGKERFRIGLKLG